MSSLVSFPTPARIDHALSDLEAESSLIGALLVENELIDSVAAALEPGDFAEPLHGRIFCAALELRAQGKPANPATLKPRFDADPAMRELGGTIYLARLTQRLDGLFGVEALSERIAGLAERRRRLEWLTEQTAATWDAARPLGDLTAPQFRDTRGLTSLDLASLANFEPKPKRFIIPQLAPAGEVTLFTGAGAVGKSLLAQQLATALAAGRNTLGLDIRRGPAIYLTAEDDADQLHWRQKHLCAALDVRMADLAGSLHLISRRGELNYLAVSDGGPLEPTSLFGQVARLTRSIGASALFIDNVAHVFPGDENDRGEVTQFINLLNGLAGSTGAAIILLGHPNKAGDSYSGSTGWLNAVRSQIYLERPKGSDHDPDLRVLHIGKPNYTRAGEAFRCRWHDWAFILDEDLPQDQRSELAETIACSAENEAFMACLRVRASQGNSRAVGPKPGPSFAPSQFEGMPQARGYDRQALKRAMERLLTIGRIECETVENKAKGRETTIIREVLAASPNSFPNSSRTLFPNSPELHPNPARTHPDHTPPPTGEDVGALESPEHLPEPKGDC